VANDVQEDVKRLLILLLLKLGSTSDEIGSALNVDSSVIRKMMPLRKVKKLVKSSEE
jgi:predicted transcriptional regulator